MDGIVCKYQTNKFDSALLVIYILTDLSAWSVTVRELLKSPTIIVDLFISTFGSFNFYLPWCFVIRGTYIHDCYVFSKNESFNIK